MCKLKSGIILKDRCFVPDYDSHEKMLDALGLEDSFVDASHTFVRAELSPKNNEYFSDIDTWKIKIDQDIVPDWFEEDREKYISEFKEEVKKWAEGHIHVDKEIDEIKSDTHYLLRCEVETVSGDAELHMVDSSVTCMYDNSTFIEMHGTSAVTNMYDNSTVGRMFNNSTVGRMYNTSTVSNMGDNSSVGKMFNNSTINNMYGTSAVTNMYDNSVVNKMCDTSTVRRMYDNAIVGVMCDNTTVRKMWGNSAVTNMYDNSTVNKNYDNSMARCNYLGTVYCASDYKIERK